MRRVSMKRKSGRRSSRSATDQAESSAKEKNADNGEVVSDEEAGNHLDEEYEPPAKKKSNKKDKSVSFNNASDEEEEEADTQYEVEAVLGEKMIKRVKHYLIRWKGYDADSDTWEPANTLNCMELIKEFHANTPSTSTNSKKQKTKNGKKSTKSETTPVTWSETEEFEVDRILEVHHKRDGTREFLVSWKGYPASENSWEPEENMTCGDLIKKFMAKVEKAKETDLRELREKRTPTNRFTLNDATKGRRWSKRNSGKQRVQYHDSE